MTEKTYRFYWRTGKPDDGKGNDPADALTKLGFGAGAIAALDYWELLPDPVNPNNSHKGEMK